MELLLKNTSLLLAIALTGLSAGLFYAWQVSVIPGTKQILDRSYLETMQSINRAILNPGFYIIFMGSLLFLMISSYQQYNGEMSLSFLLIIGATLSYLIGTFGVTILGNVPMNEALDAVKLEGLTDELLAKHRKSFEGRWNQLHTIRTWFSIVAFIAILLSAFLNQFHYE